MTKNVKALIFLISSIVLSIVSVVLIIVASVNSTKYGKLDYSHNVKIEEVQTDPNAVNGVVYHYVVLDGAIYNNTNESYKTISVEIVLAGVNNGTGEYAEFVSSFEISDFNSNSKIDLSKEKIKVGNRNGYVPESIKEIKIMIDGELQTISFEENNDNNLVLFALALGLVFVAGLMLSMWNNARKGHLSQNKN